jgi:hypothetical protein
VCRSPDPVSFAVMRGRSIAWHVRVAVLAKSRRHQIGVTVVVGKHRGVRLRVKALFHSVWRVADVRPNKVGYDSRRRRAACFSFCSITDFMCQPPRSGPGFSVNVEAPHGMSDGPVMKALSAVMRHDRAWIRLMPSAA